MAAEAVAQDQVLVRLPRLGVAQQYGDQSKNNQIRLLKEEIKLTFLFDRLQSSKVAGRTFFAIIFTNSKNFSNGFSLYI